jgi:hypothetical protein
LRASTIFKLYSPSLSSSQYFPICSNELAHCSKTLGRTWNNHIANNILSFHLIKTMIYTLPIFFHVNNFKCNFILFWIHNHI